MSAGKVRGKHRTLLTASSPQLSTSSSKASREERVNTAKTSHSQSNLNCPILKSASPPQPPPPDSTTNTTTHSQPHTKAHTHQTNHLSAKRGACEGKAQAAIPAFGWYHVKLGASSLFLLKGFVSHANSSSGLNMPGQALHPNWHGPFFHDE
ncbi:hypothetical protein NQZ68_026558 [Dissostichus eleginoides]|nr:hypothetical protein NQZ68_026558 [Dissostichus eleginoides]